MFTCFYEFYKFLQNSIDFYRFVQAFIDVHMFLYTYSGFYKLLYTFCLLYMLFLRSALDACPRVNMITPCKDLNSSSAHRGVTLGCARQGIYLPNLAGIAISALQQENSPPINRSRRSPSSCVCDIASRSHIVRNLRANPGQQTCNLQADMAST